MAQHHLVGAGSGLKRGSGCIQFTLQQTDGLAVEGVDQAEALTLQIAHQLIVVAQAAAQVAEAGFGGLVLVVELVVGLDLRRLEEHVAAAGAGLDQLLLQQQHPCLGLLTAGLYGTTASCSTASCASAFFSGGGHAIVQPQPVAEGVGLGPSHRGLGLGIDRFDALAQVGDCIGDVAAAVAAGIGLVGAGDALDHRQHQGLVGVGVGDVEHGSALLELHREVVFAPVAEAHVVHVLAGALLAGAHEVVDRLEHRRTFKHLHFGLEAVLAAAAAESGQTGQHRVGGGQLGQAAAAALLTGQHDLKLPLPHRLAQEGVGGREQQGAASHLGDQAPAAL